MHNPSPWGAPEKAAWLAEQRVQRCYFEDVVAKLELLKERFSIAQYAALSYAPEKYPLYVVKTRPWDTAKKNILITGGVHGYETSGVSGALRFLETQAQSYAQHFNIIVFPCVSPWGYETINRWNPHALDPNRCFYDASPAEESVALMKAITSLSASGDAQGPVGNIFAHFDLHETTDTDNTIFRPALQARDGVEQPLWNIPDGFYLVGDSENPRDEFQREIIQAVKRVTHIAPADDEGRIIGEPISQEGVINYAVRELGLCTGFSGCQYSTTTEVYPDSAQVTEEDCIRAQVSAVTGGLEYLLSHQA